jgi:hypothetical protein
LREKENRDQRQRHEQRTSDQNPKISTARLQSQNVGEALIGYGNQWRRELDPCRHDDKDCQQKKSWPNEWQHNVPVNTESEELKTIDPS